MQIARRTSRRMSYPPILRPTMQDIAWAAGIYEGEGCCYPTGKNKFHLVVQVNQKRRWILDRLRDRFGGMVYLDKWQKGEQYRWTATGVFGRGFLMTIYVFLSPHRKLQIWRALHYELCALSEAEANSEEVTNLSEDAG